ncbi:hypothetical protein BXY39_3859 [Eilatimonas milleporae]|uniref:Uncharacterized protein n=1 Tax=Eilatimonas milleporae TaxID=911205 RepID=A0A3M0BT27_9PROT|nr:hypothetical protein BXY39_3859 [Eilatimonas milleporae]
MYDAYICPVAIGKAPMRTMGRGVPATAANPPIRVKRPTGFLVTEWYNPFSLRYIIP